MRNLSISYLKSKEYQLSKFEDNAESFVEGLFSLTEGSATEDVYDVHLDTEVLNLATEHVDDIIDVMHNAATSEELHDLFTEMQLSLTAVATKRFIQMTFPQVEDGDDYTQIGIQCTLDNLTGWIMRVATITLLAYQDTLMMGNDPDSPLSCVLEAAEVAAVLLSAPTDKNVRDAKTLLEDALGDVYESEDDEDDFTPAGF